MQIAYTQQKQYLRNDTMPHVLTALQMNNRSNALIGVMFPSMQTITPSILRS